MSSRVADETTDTTTAPAAVTADRVSGESTKTSPSTETNVAAGSSESAPAVVTLTATTARSSSSPSNATAWNRAVGHASPVVTAKPHAPGTAPRTRSWISAREDVSSAAATAPSQKHPTSFAAATRAQQTRQPMSSSKISDTLSSIGMHVASAMMTEKRQLEVELGTTAPRPAASSLSAA